MIFRKLFKAISDGYLSENAFTEESLDLLKRRAFGNGVIQVKWY
jgi:hypothetical protein